MSRTPGDSAAVSVIIPAWNAGPFIGACIESVLRQHPQPAEVLVIDDGSTDATAAIARSFPAPVKVISQANAGVSAARNLGVSQARQPLLAFLDADDIMAAGRIQRHCGLLAGRPDLDLVFGLQVCFATATPPLDSPVDGTATGGPIASTLTCRGEVFKRIGGFSTDLRGSETIDWLSRARNGGVQWLVDEKVAVWRRLHGRSLSRPSQRIDGHYLEAVKRHLDRMRGR